MTQPLRPLLRCAGALLVFAALFSMLLVNPLSASFRTDTGVVLHAWQSRQLYVVFPLLLLGLLAAIGLIWRWMGLQLAQCPGAPTRILLALRPLLLLPAAAFGGYLTPWIGLVASGLFLPYGTSLIAAWTLENLLGDTVSAVQSKPPRLFSWSVLAYGLFIFAVGMHFADKSGRGSGDEDHYLTQLVSLVEDGNLELSDEMEPVIRELGPPAIRRSHMVVNTAGRMHSYHSFGLPLLAWPLGFFGVFGRQLVLAIIAALAAAGCRAACLAAQAPPRAAAVVTWTLAFSYTWAMYSTRFLPEILGCGLLAWGCWALAAQQYRRWTAAFVCALCCGFLPYAHVRWAPPSLVVAAFFGFEGLFLKGERPGAKFARLLVFAAIYAAFGLSLIRIHATFFSGSQAYNYGKILFSYPQAMWGMFTDRRGLLGLLPALLWFVVALPFCLALGRKAALRAAEGAAVLAAVLLTSCTTSAALAGACIPGRYLLTAVPALLPPAALALSRCGRTARVWLYFLTAMPVLFYAYVGTLIKYSYGPFFRVPEKLRGYVGFHTYWEPLTSYLENVDPASLVYASAFVVLLVLFTAALLVGRRRPRSAVIAGSVLLAAAGYCGFVSDKLENSQRGTRFFLLCKDNPWQYFFTEDRMPSPELFATFVGHPKEGASPHIVLIDRPKTLDDPASFTHAKDIPPNDWNDRDIRWRGIRPNQIRHNFDGFLAFRVVGRVNRGRARFAVRQGAVSLEEDLVMGQGPFDFTWLVRTRKGLGFTNTIFTLEDGVGEVTIDFYQLAPYSPRMRDSGFVFPPTTQVRDLTAR